MRIECVVVGGECVTGGEAARQGERKGEGKEREKERVDCLQGRVMEEGREVLDRIKGGGNRKESKN